MRKVFAYIVMLVMALSFILPTNAVSAQSIAELEQELAELEAEQSNISEDASDAEQQLKENEQRQAEVNEKIDSINNELEVTEEDLVIKQTEINDTNQQISLIESSITETEAEIELTEEEILELNEEIDHLINRIAERDELIKTRLRSIQHNGGNVNYLQVILGSQSFGDFINRATAVARIMDQDRGIIETQQVDKENLEDKRIEVEDKQEQLIVKKENLSSNKAELDHQRATLVAQEQELVNLQAQLNEQKDEQSNLMVELEEEFEELEEYTVTLADQQEIKRSEAAALEKAIELAKEREREEQRIKQLAAENDTTENGDTGSGDSGGSSGSGDTPPANTGSTVLAWPASTRRVTSPHGYRIHPVTGARGSYHRGIDIADPGDQQIYAAEAGVVTATYTEHDGRMNGYGDAIMITHYLDINGDGNQQQITTFYAHLRAGTTLVSPGDTVQRGQHIAMMGATGVGTGQHLHFEVHIGGWYGPRNAPGNDVDPLIYLR